MLNLADREARSVLFNDERGNSLIALGLIGHGKDNIYVSLSAVSDEALAAVKNPMVTIEDCHGLLCS